MLYLLLSINIYFDFMLAKTDSGLVAKLTVISLIILLATALVVIQADFWQAGSSKGERDKNYEVITSIAQLGEPIAHITDGCVNVKNLLGSGTDPHLYRLTRLDTLYMHRADMVFYVGHLLEAQMEPFLESLRRVKPVYPMGEIIDVSLLNEVEPNIYDPHLWMDPVLWHEVLERALAIIAKRYPQCEETIEIRSKIYFAKLLNLHKQAQEFFSLIPIKQRVLVTSHDAFGYFGSSYNIEVRALQGISTDRQISINKINTLVDEIVEHNIKTVFVESSVSSRDMRAVIEGAASLGHRVEIGGQLYSDAMGKSGSFEGTYIGMLMHNINTIASAWKEGTAKILFIEDKL